jgi:hypothetical protein
MSATRPRRRGRSSRALGAYIDLVALERHSGSGTRQAMEVSASFLEDRHMFGASKDFFRRWRPLFGFNKTATGATKWSLEHMIIKQRWYRTVGGKPSLFAVGTPMNRLMQTLGDAGWNLVRCVLVPASRSRSV